MNRKEQIANLEREIEQKTQTLNQLQEAEEREESDTSEDLSPEDKKAVDDFISNIFN